ncbi:MAG: hypothetical protein QXM38_04815 [Candidatus Aenigmatarchaeota archaeon]
MQYPSLEEILWGKKPEVKRKSGLHKTTKKHKRRRREPSLFEPIKIKPIKWW